MKDIDFINIPEFSTQSPRWEVMVDLSNVRYRLNISWNTQMEGWVLAIMDNNGTLILGGIRLSMGQPDLLVKYRATITNLPPGQLWVMDLTDDYHTAELGRNDFATRYKLCYGEVLE
jgi:hypothetical protein